MRRRGNKSNKVPNVKLRPAEKGSMPRPIIDNCWAQETQLGSDDIAPLDLCPRPFKGLVICATGISDKPTLFKQAVELGANHTPAFTDRVTHLVADCHGGAKYICAVERKIPIVKSTWIIENHKIWLRGDDVDLHKSAEEHRLPIFSGVVVCPSGITDITRRTEISKLVTTHQGSYTPKLERPVKVTHLLCSGDEETDKMRYAEKFNTRGEAMIHLVWEEWFWDSLHYGGRFDETTYQVRRPRPEPKPIFEAATPPPPSSDACSQHDYPTSSITSQHQPQGLQPPANNPDETEDEPAFFNVLPAVTLQLWSSLLGRRGYQVVDGEVILSPSKSKEEKGQKLRNQRPKVPTPAEIPVGRSILSSFRRANSFAPVVPEKEAGSSLRQLPFRRAITSAAALAGNETRTRLPAPVAVGAEAGSSTGVGTAAAAAPASSELSVSPHIFAGMSFRALGEAKTQAVRNAVEQFGGRMSTDEDEDVTFILVRLFSGSKIYQQEEDENHRKKYRTECWLEHCIYEERICKPDERISFVPLSISIPVNGAETVLMSISGFDQSECCGLKRLLRALGITLVPMFTRRSTVLLCPSGTGLKYEKAQEWSVPVVGLEWLKEMATTGEIPEVEKHVVKRCASSIHIGIVANNEEDGRVVDVAEQGKGKATSVGMDDAMGMDVDLQMHDVTTNPAGAAVERQATTIISNPEPPERLRSMASFPNETIEGRTMSSYLEELRRYSSLPQTATQSMAMIPHEGRTSAESTTLSWVGPRADSLPMSCLRERQPTVLDLGEREGERVPSSKSPSPMKVPSQTGGSRLSLSPVKIDHDATKALQESITSLLGKRASPDGDELVVGADGKTGPARRGRNGKRARPQKSKTQTRQASNASIEVLSKANPNRPQTRGSKAAAAALEVTTYADPSLNPFESYADDLEVADNGESQQESVRVMYEDPGQRDEKRRLMNLLKGKASEGEPETLSMLSGLRSIDRPTRRSTRIPGF